MAYSARSYSTHLYEKYIKQETAHGARRRGGEFTISPEN
jgi:hypothetical protein